VIANARQAIAFEDEYPTESGTSRCWVTLLPFSSTGTYVDYVYGFVSQAADGAKAEDVAEVDVAEEVAEIEAVPEEAVEPEAPVEEELARAEPVSDEETAEVEAEVVEDEQEMVAEEVEEPVAEFVESAPEAEYDEPEPETSNEKRPGFSKFFDALAGVGNFYGNVVQMDSKMPTANVDDEELEAEVFDRQEIEQEVDSEPEEAAADDQESELDEVEAVEPETAMVEDHPIKESKSAPEGSMQSKLADVRSKADEARMAKLRANAALYEGLSAAYDFALDAEENAEEYLKLVEAQGLKIQLRSPMKPVVKLAFDGLCDEATISQLETVLAWALKQDLPRGSLAERIESEGGLGSILNGKAAA
jgi:hypothetical protein